MTAPIGRPLKYGRIILALDPDRLYTAAAVARFAAERGFLGTEPKEREIRRSRVRIAMGRFSNQHAFPDEGDGILTLPGQPPLPAWYGRRWQAVVRKRLGKEGSNPV